MVSFCGERMGSHTAVKLQRWSNGVVVGLCGLLSLFVLCRFYDLTSIDHRSLWTSSEDDGRSQTVVLLFMFFGLSVGILAMQFLSVVGEAIPYTVFVFLIGVLFSIANKEDYGTFGQSVRQWVNIDADLMLYIFLPPLVFGEAMTLNWYHIKRAFFQSIILAGPGVWIGAALMGTFTKLVLPYDWSWVLCMVFGSIMSATDTVAVVALLKSVGASPKLTILVVGESLINDGSAMALFTLFFKALNGATFTVGSIISFCLATVFGSVSIGILFGLVAVRWLRTAHNPLKETDVTTQIAITFCCAYLSFFTAQYAMELSGVLSCCSAGIMLAWQAPAVILNHESMHNVWSMVEWILNTMIFLLAGLIIGNRILSEVHFIDWVYLLVLYVGLVAVRFICMLVLFPFISRIGHGCKIQEVCFMSWAGLRGALGMALALIVEKNSPAHLSAQTSRLFFYVGGVSALTLIINATTSKAVLLGLGLLNTDSAEKQLVTNQVKRKLRKKMNEVIGHMTKEFRFTHDDLDAVRQSCSLLQGMNMDTLYRDSEMIAASDRAQIANSAIAIANHRTTPSTFLSSIQHSEASRLPNTRGQLSLLAVDNNNHLENDYGDNIHDRHQLLPVTAAISPSTSPAPNSTWLQNSNLLHNDNTKKTALSSSWSSSSQSYLKSPPQSQQQRKRVVSANSLRSGFISAFSTANSYVSINTDDEQKKEDCGREEFDSDDSSDNDDSEDEYDGSKGEGSTVTPFTQQTPSASSATLPSSSSSIVTPNNVVQDQALLIEQKRARKAQRKAEKRRLRDLERQHTTANSGGTPSVKDKKRLSRKQRQRQRQKQKQQRRNRASSHWSLSMLSGVNGTNHPSSAHHSSNMSRLEHLSHLLSRGNLDSRSFLDIDLLAYIRAIFLEIVRVKYWHNIELGKLPRLSHSAQFLLYSIDVALDKVDTEKDFDDDDEDDDDDDAHCVYGKGYLPHDWRCLEQDLDEEPYIVRFLQEASYCFPAISSTSSPHEDNPPHCGYWRQRLLLHYQARCEKRAVYMLTSFIEAHEHAQSKIHRFLAGLVEEQLLHQMAGNSAGRHPQNGEYRAPPEQHHHGEGGDEHTVQSDGSHTAHALPSHTSLASATPEEQKVLAESRNAVQRAMQRLQAMNPYTVSAIRSRQVARLVLAKEAELVALMVSEGVLTAQHAETFLEEIAEDTRAMEKERERLYRELATRPVPLPMPFLHGANHNNNDKDLENDHHADQVTNTDRYSSMYTYTGASSNTSPSVPIPIDHPKATTGLLSQSPGLAGSFGQSYSPRHGSSFSLSQSTSHGGSFSLSQGPGHTGPMPLLGLITEEINEDQEDDEGERKLSVNPVGVSPATASAAQPGHPMRRGSGRVRTLSSAATRSRARSYHRDSIYDDEDEDN